VKGEELPKKEEVKEKEIVANASTLEAAKKANTLFLNVYKKKD